MKRAIAKQHGSKMVKRPGSLLCVGECMMELARGADGRFALAFGGDTFNTAIYAARMGMKSAYATSLGDDPYSDGIVAQAESENVDTSLITRRQGVMPGLYLIETKQGERTFYYWRDHSPARTLFEQDEAARRIATFVQSTDVVYFSGITLSIYSPAGLDVFERTLRNARKAGAKIAFDSNYRGRGWRDDSERARNTFKRFLALCDIALPSLDDEQTLWGDKDASASIERLVALGVPEIVVKAGADGAYFIENGSIAHVRPPERVTPIDTTAAGDSFNAGYLARRAANATQRDAIDGAHQLAGIVIRYPGAIAPREATIALTNSSADASAPS
jgi:2-dehydro-3-deoxygluconokinase